jgi:hypothetical protein
MIDPVPLQTPDSTGLVVIFHDAWGEVVQRFDVADLDLPAEVAAMLAAAFRGHYPGKAAETRKGCWRALIVFARFVEQDNRIGALGDLTNESVGRYLAWLDRQRSRAGKPWSLAVRHNRYHHIKTLLEWIGRCHPDYLPDRLAFPYNPFPGRHAAPAHDPRRLTATQLKAILRGCYEEIDAAWALFEEGRRILANTPDAEHRLTHDGLLRLVHHAGSGAIMSRRALQRCFGVGRAIGRHGGPDNFARYLHLTSDTLAPFFVAIAIQTAANSDALRLIDRDCVEPHPLVEHRAVIDWAKGRAGRMLKRAQRRSFDRRRPHAAPNLIDKVLAMTAPLAALAPLGERDRLFLLRRPHRQIGVVQPQTLYNAIARFIERENARVAAWNAEHPDRLRSTLPPFTPMLFRGSVATEHYRASGGDIRAAQAVLNHSRADTTESYIRGPQARRLQQETIARLQSMMVAWITDRRSAAGAMPPSADHCRQSAEAFGHRCADPFAGSAGERLCPRFGGCLACPGLVVPVDAEHLARVLLAIRQLDTARQQVDPHRWALIYGSSYRILTEDILPDFPADLRVAAEQLMPTLPTLPSLE